MARISRMFVDYACYHIVTRGNQKRLIFNKEDDFIKYLLMLKKAKRKYGVSLYAYCLMPNHVHLLIEAIKSRNISKFMHWLNRGYTAYFNAKYETVGHVWQGRFKSKPIVKGRYLIHCATYIEINPVRAHLVNDIAEYRWSSYRERSLLTKTNVIDEFKIEYSDETTGTRLI